MTAGSCMIRRGVPSASLAPLSRTTTLWHNSVTNRTLCSTRRMATPFALTSLRRSAMPATRVGLTPEVASSSSSSFGSLISAIPISSRRRWPPDRAPARSSRSRASRRNSRRDSTRRRVAGSVRPNRRAVPICPHWMLNSMFSETVSSRYTRISWKVRARPSRAT